MKVLSIRQPWCSSIFRLNKDVENRSWSTSHRGALLIHASSTFDTNYLASREFKEYADLAPAENSMQRVAKSVVARGAIIGVVTLDDVVRDAQSLWACADNYHWLISNAVEFAQPIPCNGKLQLWNLPEHLERDVRRQLPS